MSLPPKIDFRIYDYILWRSVTFATILDIDLIYYLLLLEMDGDPETFGVCYVEEIPLVCFHEQGILTSLL